MRARRSMAPLIAAIAIAVAPGRAAAEDVAGPLFAATYVLSYTALTGAGIGLGIYDLATWKRPPNRAAAISDVAIGSPLLAISLATVGLSIADLATANQCTGFCFDFRDFDYVLIGVGAFTTVLSSLLIAHGAVQLQALRRGESSTAPVARRGPRWTIAPSVVPGRSGSAGLALVGVF